MENIFLFCKLPNGGCGATGWVWKFLTDFGAQSGNRTHTPEGTRF